MSLDALNRKVALARDVYLVAPEIGKDALYQALMERGKALAELGEASAANEDFDEAKKCHTGQPATMQMEDGMDFFQALEEMPAPQPADFSKMPAPPKIDLPVKQTPQKSDVPGIQTPQKIDLPVKQKAMASPTQPMIVPPAAGKAVDVIKIKVWRTVWLILAICALIAVTVLAILLGERTSDYHWMRSRYYDANNQVKTLESGLTVLNEVNSAMLDNITPYAGPFSGRLVHYEDDYVETYTSDVNLENFISVVEFQNPYDASHHAWDMGIMFRHIAGNDQYRLTIESDGDVSIILRNGDESNFIVSGTASQLLLEAGERNTLVLFVKDTRAVVFLNGEMVITTDQLKLERSGDISVGTGFIGGDEVKGEVTRFYDFKIFSLD